MTALADLTYDAPPRTRCGTPGCHRKPGHGRLGIWCRACATTLAAIRQALKDDAALRCPSTANGRKRVQLTPRCCTLGCFNDRQPPAAFCDKCAESGCVEEDAA